MVGVAGILSSLCPPAFGADTGGRILSEDISVTERKAQPVRMWSVPAQQGGKGSAFQDEVQGESAGAAGKPVVETRSPQKISPRTDENLLDSMDVYALSPHARALALPRMVSREMVLQARAGRLRMPAPAEWKAIVERASHKYGLPAALVAAVIRVESNFDVVAESPKGAQGLMQLMPGTQEYLGVADPFNPEANVDAGSRYLREQLNRFGSLELALAAYNAGPGNVERYGGVPPFAETQAYVRRVLSEMH